MIRLNNSKNHERKTPTQWKFVTVAAHSINIIKYYGLNIKVKVLKFLENKALSLGTGNGDALRTAFLTERSKIVSPHFPTRFTFITSPLDNKLTCILQLNLLVNDFGLLQLSLIFCSIATIKRFVAFLS